MAEHRRRRLLQFGILDLLILTAVVAVGGVLSRPTPAKAWQAKPYVIGAWANNDGMLMLFPDGYYFESLSSQGEEGFGWKISPHSMLQGAFVLTCGKQRYVLRSEWGSGALELLSDDGGPLTKVPEICYWEGPTKNGAPHGTWTVAQPSVDSSMPTQLEYHNGKLMDIRCSDGTHNWELLNHVRRLCGLADRTERDFSDQRTAKEQRPD